MQIAIRLAAFYAPGDERRFFDGLNDVGCITNVHGVARDLLFDLDLARLSGDRLRELIALLYRYGVGLAPLRPLADRKRFAWLDDARAYWYGSMFAADSLV